MWWPFKKKKDPITACIVKTILDDLRIYHFSEWHIEYSRYNETFSHPKIAYKLITESTRSSSSVEIQGMTVTITSNFLSWSEQFNIWCELKRIRKLKDERYIDNRAKVEVETLKTMFPKCFQK